MYQYLRIILLQGDEEKALGRTPIPMMDRNTADKLPQHQVFLQLMSIGPYVITLATQFLYLKYRLWSLLHYTG